MGQELYELPDGWEWKTLADTCEMYQPKTISSKKMLPDGKYPVFGANGIIGSYDEYNHENVELLITCRGATCGTVNLSVPYSWINGNAMVVRPLEHNVDLHFLKYAFEGGIKTSDAITGSAQPQITRTSLNPLTFPLPPLNEQKRIVTKLDALFTRIDTAITHLQQTLELSKALFASALDEVFQETYSKNPVEKLSKLTSKIGSGATPKGGQKSYKTEGISLIRSLNVHDACFKEKGLAYIDDTQAALLSNVEVKSGDVLLNITGASVARSCVVPNEYLPARVNQHVSILRPKNMLNSVFLNYLIISPSFKNDLLFQGAGGATRQALTKTMLQNLDIPIPAIGEQKRIVDHLNSLAERTRTLEASTQEKINDLTALKASLLDTAFKGEL